MNKTERRDEVFDASNHWPLTGCGVTPHRLPHRGSHSKHNKHSGQSILCKAMFASQRGAEIWTSLQNRVCVKLNTCMHLFTLSFIKADLLVFKLVDLVWKRNGFLISRHENVCCWCKESILVGAAGHCCSVPLCTAWNWLSRNNCKNSRQEHLHVMKLPSPAAGVRPWKNSVDEEQKLFSRFLEEL